MEKSTQIFHNNEIPKEGCQFICLFVILIDFVFRTGKNFYPQSFLGECKYDAKGKKLSKYITDDTEISSDSYRESSDEKNFNEKNSKEES